MFSENMLLDKHITTICQSDYAEIRRISSVRQYLTVEATKTLVCAFVLSKVDYGYSLLSDCPLYIVQKLQKVQHSAARLILKARRGEHVQSLLQTLHWWPIQARIDYKLSILCHNLFSQSASPAYIPELLSIYIPCRQLRSFADTRTLHIFSCTDKDLRTTLFLLLWPQTMGSLFQLKSATSKPHHPSPKHLRFTCSNSTVSLSVFLSVYVYISLLLLLSLLYYYYYFFYFF